MLLEKQIEEIIENGNKKKVLGETTTASESAEIAELQSLISSGEDSSATDAADLEKLLLSQQEQTQASTSAQLAIANVARKGGKEILVTTSLLNVWKLKPNAVINKAVKLEYIVSGGLIPGVAGRVLSNSEEYRIVGVIKDDTKPLIYAPIADLESMGIKKYTMAKLLATNNEELSSVRERVESLGFTTQSIVDTLLQVDRLFRIMRFLLGAFGMIALVVAIFGMFNTLTVSLLERTREVGVMKTLGTTDADIVKLFLVESLIIGFLGGVVGILVGAGGGSFINLFSALVSGNSTISLFKTPPSFMIIILLVSVAVGLLTGLYPSGRAKKISALNALRYE
jgi:ABC-type antimicrobial peptide transport system permease subunit